MRDKLGYNLRPHESPLKKIKRSFDLSATPEDLKSLSSAFCDYVGVKYAYPCASYSEALMAAFYAVGVGPDANAATSAYNFPEVAGSIELLGGSPVFIDSDIPSFNMNMSHLELMINNELKAVVASHMFGMPCAMDSVMEAAGIYKLFVIEDVNTSLGAVYKGVKCGNWGHISVFNFDSASLIDCGCGGMIATSNEKINARLRAIMNLGYDGSGELRIPAPDFSMSPDIGRNISESLKFIDDLLEYKYMISKHYRRELMYHSEIILPEQNPYALNTFNYFPAYFKNPSTYSKMQKILSKLRFPKRKTPVVLPTSNYYKSKYSLSADSYKNAALTFSNTLFLPNDFSSPFEKIEEMIKEVKGL
ncbi:MAG TPA: DegT/DnrJ/EryC1/StrS family aminotransferase [Candidatus Wallbacteria bacterium]|nr:DegT/DnrJ/EryC1/StrS family aminotransferase [Candidatus Wallbacteria bacterium]